jgi:hypothetical protein
VLFGRAREFVALLAALRRRPVFDDAGLTVACVRLCHKRS